MNRLGSMGQRGFFGMVGGLGGGAYGAFHGPEDSGLVDRGLGMLGWSFVGGVGGGLMDLGAMYGGFRYGRPGRQRVTIMTRAFNGFSGMKAITRFR